MLKSFRPQLIPTIVLIIVVPLFLYLANWQFKKSLAEKFRQEKVLINQSQLSEQLPTIVNSDDKSEEFNSILYKNLRLNGKLVGVNFFLDNQINDDKAGFRLYSLFKVKNHPLILIDRGFIPQIKGREVLPELPQQYSDEVQIEGFLTPITNRFLAEEYRPKINDKIWQTIDINLIENALNQKIYPLQLAVQKVNGIKGSGITHPVDFLFAPTKFENSQKILMHQGYAGQWLLFALTAIVLWVYYSFRSQKKDTIDHDFNSINGVTNG